MAKAAGILMAIVVFALWFYLIGAQPVLETVVGMVLAFGGGIWAWAALDRRRGEGR